MTKTVKGKVCVRAKWTPQTGVCPDVCSMKRLGVFLLPYPWTGYQSITGLPLSIKFSVPHLFTWVTGEAQRLNRTYLEQEQKNPTAQGLKGLLWIPNHGLCFANSRITWLVLVISRITYSRKNVF